MKVTRLENIKAAEENHHRGSMRCREASDLGTSSPVESFSVQISYFPEIINYRINSLFCVIFALLAALKSL